jgi:hypothetical protein
MQSGDVQRCCGATSSQTDDSRQTVFYRIVAVLEKDDFYSLAEST